MKNAQGSLEYLLIIGVVILIAAVVIGAITGVLSFGRLSASKEQADSVYTGLQDVMDLSKGRTLLNIKLKQGENVLEFNDVVEKTIWTIFGSLPENTQIIFSGAKNCTTELIDANKKADGEGSAYFQNPTAALQNFVVNGCIVPANTIVTINVPENTEINVPAEQTGEAIIFLSDTNFVQTIMDNPSGSFKLNTDIINTFINQTPSDRYVMFPIDFTGQLNGNGKKIVTPSFEGTEYLFNSLSSGAKIENLTIERDSVSGFSNNLDFYIAPTCTIPYAVENISYKGFVNYADCQP